MIFSFRVTSLHSCCMLWMRGDGTDPEILTIRISASVFAGKKAIHVCAVCCPFRQCEFSAQILPPARYAHCQPWSYNTPICRRSLPVAVAHSRSSCQLTRNRLSVPSTCSIFNPLGKSRDPFVKVKLTKSTSFPSPLKHRQFVELNRLCAIFPSALAAARQISRDTWRQ